MWYETMNSIVALNQPSGTLLQPFELSGVRVLDKRLCPLDGELRGIM